MFGSALLVVLSTVDRANAQSAERVPALSSGAAPAEEADPPGYREAIDEAVAEYAAGNFAESRALFQRAHDIAPSARTLRGLGMAEFELRNYAASADLLQQALSSQAKPLQGELRGETEALLGRARGFLGRYQIVLDPPDAKLTVDGAPARLGPGGELSLAVGDHVIEASAPQRSSIRKTLRVTGGEQASLELKLPLAAVAPTNSPAGPSEPGPAERDDDSLLSSPWLWIAVGAVALGGAVGIGVAASSGGGTTPAAPYGGDSGTVLSGP